MKKENHQLNQKFAGAVAEFQGLVYSITFSICNNGDDAWDLTQEVFVKAWQCENFFNDDFNRKAWLAKVARNEALKRRRSLRSKWNYLLRFCGFEESTDASELENKLMKSQQIGQLKTLLQQLDDDERQIIVLRFAADMSYKEIAESMDIKIGTVMSRLARLKEKLGSSFEEDEV